MASHHPRNFLFIHGGPGLNSLAEEELLGPAIRAAGGEVEFWNEPSDTRPDGEVFVENAAFENVVSSIRRAILRRNAAGGPVDVIAHSFATLYVLRILDEIPSAVGSLTLIAPTFDYNSSFKNVLRLASEEARMTSLETSTRIAESISKTQFFFDVDMKRGFEFAATVPTLFSRYWKNHERMDAFFKIWGQRAAAFDARSFFAICETLPRSISGGSAGALTLGRVRVCFGNSDPIIDREKTLLDIPVFFPVFSETSFDASGHYPHIEETEKFMQVLFSPVAK